MTPQIWVLYRTDREGGIILGGTTFDLKSAQAWSAGADEKGAIRLPVNGLAHGERY